MNNKLDSYLPKLVITGLMAALVFVFSMISFPIPTPLGDTRIHLGNAMCLLAGYLCGGLYGGAAAGIGSMLYDFTSPIYIASAPFTLVFKFLLAFFCGVIAYAKGSKGEKFSFNLIGGIVGSTAYMVLHLSKQIFTKVFFDRLAFATVLVSAGADAVTSLINAILAIIISIPLAYLLKSALKKAKIEF